MTVHHQEVLEKQFDAVMAFSTDTKEQTTQAHHEQQALILADDDYDNQQNQLAHLAAPPTWETAPPAWDSSAAVKATPTSVKAAPTSAKVARPDPPAVMAAPPVAMTVPPVTMAVPPLAMAAPPPAMDEPPVGGWSDEAQSCVNVLHYLWNELAKIQQSSYLVPGTKTSAVALLVTEIENVDVHGTEEERAKIHSMKHTYLMGPANQLSEGCIFWNL